MNHGLEYFGEGDYFVFANSRNATDPRSRVAVANLDVDAMVVWDYQVPNAFIYGADRMPTGNVPSLYWPTTMTDDVAWRAAVIVVARPVDGGQPTSALDLEVDGTTGDATRDNDPTLEEVVGWAADSVEKFFDEPLAPSASRADGALRFDARNLVKMNAAGETHFDVLDSAGVSIEAGSFSMEAVWVDGPRGPRRARERGERRRPQRLGRLVDAAGLHLRAIGVRVRLCAVGQTSTAARATSRARTRSSSRRA